MCTVDLGVLRLEDFVPHLGSRFQIEGSGFNGGHSFELVEASALGLPAKRGTRSFRLVFRANAEVALDQGMVMLHHDAVGDIRLFVVPIKDDRRERLYEAIFN